MVEQNLEEEVKELSSEFPETLGDLTEEQYSALRSQVEQSKQQQEMFSKQRAEQQMQIFESFLKRKPSSEQELKDLFELLNKNQFLLQNPANSSNQFSNWAKDFTLDELNSFVDTLPKKNASHLSDMSKVTLRWVSDIQDFGSARQNLKVLDRIIQDAKSLDPKSSAFIMGGDVVYDFHTSQDIFYNFEDFVNEHKKLLSKEEIDQVSKADPVSQKDILTQLIYQKYISNANKLISELDPNLFRGHIHGNNEFYPLMMEGMSKPDIRNALDHFLSHSVNISRSKTGIGAFFNVGGVKAFSDEYWDSDREHVVSNKSIDGEDELKKTVLYDKLKSETPNLIMLHGQPTFFYEGKRTWEHLEPDGLSRYLDEYNGSDPLYVLCGHTGKQGAVKKRNSQGRDIIMLNSNLKLNNDDPSDRPRAITYDLDIQSGKVKGFSARSYIL